MIDILAMQKTNGDALDMSLLPALDAVLGERSITRAAERIGLSQPAMSRIMAKLRIQFDDALLVRVGSSSELTPRAEALRLPLKAILEQTSQLVAPPHFDPRTADRSFHLAIPDVVAATMLSQLRMALLKVSPGCRLIVVPWPGQGADLSKLDLAIATEPGIFPNFRMEPLYDDRDVLAFRSADGSPSPEDALCQSHVAVVPAGSTRDFVDDWLSAEQKSRVIAFVVPHYLQALHLVARSDLLAILPKRLVALLGPALGVAGIELPICQTTDRYWLLHPARLAGDPANEWLRQLVRDSISASSGFDV
jgi:DNA-binding transcriptional LysR family regulator